MRFKQVCNHPAQWLGDGDYAPKDSGKFARLHEIASEIASRQDKVLVFTQFQEMTAPLADFLAGVFGRPGAVLHGGTPVKKRKALVDAFQAEDGPPFFVLSLKAGGDRPQPHRGLACNTLRPLVEPRGRIPSHGPGVPHRPEKERHGA